MHPIDDYRDFIMLNDLNDPICPPDGAELALAGLFFFPWLILWLITRPVYWMGLGVGLIIALSGKRRE